MTQFAVTRYGWMLAAWTLVMGISFEGGGHWIFSALIIVVTLIETWRAAVVPNSPTRRSDGLRIIILIFAAFDIGALAFDIGAIRLPGLPLGSCLGPVRPDGRVREDDPDDPAAKAQAGRT